ncbi:hypothetical protein [Ancrocorticia populi]|uniref:hypothetical protein n=1 Tax=Ancrocorticia populi TaxID=2175228 RepID=UPI001FAF4677|nr:hypothetical protein [Ancrocorticia populi]
MPTTTPTSSPPSPLTRLWAVARAAGFIKEGTERGKFLIGGQRIDVDTYGRLRTDPFPDTAPLEVRQWR